ncbi:MAG: hypothetical protein ACI8SE_000676 [Bacteroidia bacterium]
MDRRLFNWEKHSFLGEFKNHYFRDHVFTQSATMAQSYCRFYITYINELHSFRKEKPFEKALHIAIKSNNFEETTELLERFYTSYDLSISHKLRWHKDSPFALYNYYNERYHVPGIAGSDFPTQSETWAYWENWSKHLIDSKWNARTFLKNEKQALEMAQYNVMMLMSHELGHHIEHRHGVCSKNLNCHEYTADMVSMALIASFPEKSKLAKYQDRYLSLIRDINNSVADSSRFDALDLDIHAQCDCIDVVFPKDSSLMAQYASAYFARRLMLDSNNRLKTSEEIVDSIFRTSQNLWDKWYPRLQAKSNIVLETQNHSKMSEEDNDIYAYNKILSWGNDWIYNINTVGYDDSGAVFTMHFEWPEKQIKRALISFPIIDKNENKYFNWYYYPDSTTAVTDFKFLGFAATDVRKDFAFLTYEEDAAGI